ncbi:MAG TPA: FAD:protein FMN transferase, partial [Amycolatopsis sp.]|nr:FAD:protein FMN transferase [Amycolatopsis sp.]
PSSGHATILNLRGSVASQPLVTGRRWLQQFDQVIPQPFCAPGPNAFLYVVGPVTLQQEIALSSSGTYQSSFHAEGRLNVTPVDPSTGVPMGASYQAVVLETHTSLLSDDAASTAFFTRRSLLPSTAPGHGTFEFGFAVGPDGITRATARSRCGS